MDGIPRRALLISKGYDWPPEPRVDNKPTITRDNVPARVAAVRYLRVVDAASAVTRIEAFAPATSQVAQTTDQSSTIVFPLPLEMVAPFLERDAPGAVRNGAAAP